MKSEKKVKDSTKAKKSNEAKKAMKEIEVNKNENLAEPKDIPFSWIRKILEDKKTLKAGRDKQATYWFWWSAMKFKFTMQLLQSQYTILKSSNTVIFVRM